MQAVIPRAAWMCRRPPCPGKCVVGRICISVEKFFKLLKRCRDNLFELERSIHYTTHHSSTIGVVIEGEYYGPGGWVFMGYPAVEWEYNDGARNRNIAPLRSSAQWVAA